MSGYFKSYLKYSIKELTGVGHQAARAARKATSISHNHTNNSRKPHHLTTGSWANVVACVNSNQQNTVCKVSATQPIQFCQNGAPVFEPGDKAEANFKKEVNQP